MTAPIMNALEKGFTSKQIIDFLLRKFPEHSDKIKNASTAGFTADQIIKFLSGGRKSLNQETSPKTEFEKTRETDIGRRENVNKGAVVAGTLAATSLAAPLAASALQRAIPSSLSAMIPSLTEERLPQMMQQQPQQPPANQVADNISQPVESVQHEENIIPKEKELTEEEKKERFVNTPMGQLLEIPKKGSVVASPEGMGEVKEIRNGKAIIEIDGKKHQVEEKKLLKPPKEAAIEALELIKGFTPEAMRSTHHMLNSYDEEENKGFFVFHNGSAYVVDDISPEEYKELSEEIEEAKTTGETVIGKWAAGEGSRGAGYNKVVKGVRDRKVVPGLKKTYRKLKVGYNLLAEWQRLLNEKD